MRFVIRNKCIGGCWSWIDAHIIADCLWHTAFQIDVYLARNTRQRMGGSHERGCQRHGWPAASAASTADGRRPGGRAARDRPGLGSSTVTCELTQLTVPAGSALAPVADQVAGQAS